jgi:hypothetical protein
MGPPLGAHDVHTPPMCAQKYHVWNRPQQTPSVEQITLGERLAEQNGSAPDMPKFREEFFAFRRSFRW